REMTVCALPVQWCVSESVRRSVEDQMLRYGSDAISGTAGGRVTVSLDRSAAGSAAIARVAVSAAAARHIPGGSMARVIMVVCFPSSVVSRAMISWTHGARRKLGQ